MLKYELIDTPMGIVAVVWSKQGLRRAFLPVRGRSAAERQLESIDPAPTPGRANGALRRAIRAYYAGDPETFGDVTLDIDGGSDFERDIWDACRQIGYGHTISYGGLAAQVGRPGAARAVGRAMGRNPVAPIVPCHRVIHSCGGLGGYSGPGGLGLKQRLLDMEEAGIST